MNATCIDPETNIGTSTESRLQLLELARHLDRFGRHAEQFLRQQLEQLEREIDEFEREKSAWRRQLRRESMQLASQRAEVERLCADSSCQPPGATGDAVAVHLRNEQNSADAAARKSGEAPVRLYLQPRSASPIQVGLLMFEISKLNRDMGGQGLSFEVAEVRSPKKRLLSRNTRSDVSEEILELTGFSTLPLAARGTHVALDVDITDRIENWIAFKSRLIQSSLGHGGLAAVFKKYKTVRQDGQSRNIIHEAAGRVDDAVSQAFEQSAWSSAALFPNAVIDSVRQQVVRLEGCYERLLNDSGLRAHVELHTTT